MELNSLDLLVKDRKLKKVCAGKRIYKKIDKVFLEIFKLLLHETYVSKYLCITHLCDPFYGSSVFYFVLKTKFCPKAYTLSNDIRIEYVRMESTLKIILHYKYGTIDEYKRILYIDYKNFIKSYSVLNLFNIYYVTKHKTLMKILDDKTEKSITDYIHNITMELIKL